MYYTQPMKDFPILDGYLFKGNMLCIPHTSIREAIIRDAHSGKTLDAIASRFFWPQLRKNVANYVTHCFVCQTYKGTAQNTRNCTFLLPFARTFPWTPFWVFCVHNAADLVLAVVDRFSKMAHFLECKKTSNAVYVDSLFFREVVWVHGIPKTIVPDRDVKFLGHFWRTLSKKFDTKLKFSTTSHPQTDGQMKVTNRTLGNLIRCLSGDHPKQWHLSLAQAEFAYHHMKNCSTRKSPFEVVYTKLPRLTID